MATPPTALSIAALAAGVTLMLLAHVLVILWALRRGAAGADADDQERAVVQNDVGGKGLSAGELDTLPCHDLSSSGAHTAAECAVCLEAFEPGDRCRRLPTCDHSFHSKCVDPWLKKSRFCPVCRADVLPKGELVKVAGEEAVAAERRSTAEAEMVVLERLQQYNWSIHTGIVLR